MRETGVSSNYISSRSTNQMSELSLLSKAEREEELHSGEDFSTLEKQDSHPGKLLLLGKVTYGKSKTYILTP